MVKGILMSLKKDNFEFKEGMEQSIPIFMGYFSISLTFGLIVKAAGLPAYMAILMSITNFTGATQFISINMLTAGISIWSILLTTFMINTRYFLMSFCVADKLSTKIRKFIKNALAFGITDEVFVLAMTRDKLTTDFLFGSQLVSWCGWVGGTIAGCLLADVLPESISNSTGIAIYIMFLGLLLPAVQKSKKIAIVSLTAIVISSLFYYIPLLNKLIGNWRIILTIIVSASLGAILFPIEEVNDGK